MTLKTIHRTSSILRINPPTRLFSILSPAQACRSTQTPSCHKPTSDTGNTTSCSTTTGPPQSQNHLTFKFWTTKSAWKRASINTLRCLVGCTLGDFSALWILQTYYPHLGMGLIMGASSTFSNPLLQLNPSERLFDQEHSGLRNNHLHHP